ncbi:DUF7093 family protein [Halopiger thermotolerans]
MVLRCSLLGHDYGDAEVEREREERGSEVVVTVQEYEECTRCGERHVISENTEVTSLSAGASGDSLPDDSEPAAGSDVPSQSERTASASPSDADPASEDAAEPAAGEDVEFIDAAAGDGDAAPAASTADAPSADANADAESDAPPAADVDPDHPTDENGDPVTDDGEIIEDTLEEAADRDRGRGEWPDTDDVGPPVGADDEPTAWPDDGISDDPTEDDAVVLEHDSTSSVAGSTVSDVAGANVGPATDVDADAETATETDAEPDTGIERAGAAPTPAEDTGPDEDGVPTEFYCPRCDFVAADDRASLRAGDICPDCRKGYLGERPRR